MTASWSLPRGTGDEAHAYSYYFYVAYKMRKQGPYIVYPVRT